MIKVAPHPESLYLNPKDQVKSHVVIIESDLNLNSDIKFTTTKKNLLFIIVKIYQRSEGVCLYNTWKKWIMFLFRAGCLFKGLPQNASKHQLFQNATGRVSTRIKKSELIAAVLYLLHWLPICQHLRPASAL